MFPCRLVQLAWRIARPFQGFTEGQVVYWCWLIILLLMNAFFQQRVATARLLGTGSRQLSAQRRSRMGQDLRVCSRSDMRSYAVLVERVIREDFRWSWGENSLCFVQCELPKISDLSLGLQWSPFTGRGWIVLFCLTAAKRLPRSGKDLCGPQLPGPKKNTGSGMVPFSIISTTVSVPTVQFKRWCQFFNSIFVQHSICLAMFGVMFIMFILLPYRQ